MYVDAIRTSKVSQEIVGFYSRFFDFGTNLALLGRNHLLLKVVTNKETMDNVRVVFKISAAPEITSRKS